MGDSFPPEQDLDAFKQTLAKKLSDDDQTKEIAILWISYAVLTLLVVAAIVAFMARKTFLKSLVPSQPVVVGPCPRGAYVAVPSLQTCDYVMCPEFDKSGNLVKGFFQTLEDCEASMGQLFYPTLGSTSGVSFAFCTTIPPSSPIAGWTGPSSYQGANAQQNCQADVTAYNATLNFGVKCDFTQGPTLCSPADGQTCIGSPNLYADPTNIASSGCLMYSGCTANACASFFTNSRTFPQGYSNIGLGSCSDVNPCAVCGNNCLVFDPTKQLAPIAATKSAGATAQVQNGSTVTSTPNACAAKTANACDSPSDCCAQTS
jgi:hypothetical protein